MKRFLGFSVVVSICGTDADAQVWQHVHGGLIHDVEFLDEDFGCTVEDGGRIRYTDDGGVTWTHGNTPETVRDELFGLDWVNEDLIFACGANGVILKSTTQGATWSIATTTDGPITDTYDDGNEIDCGERFASLQDIFMIDTTNGWCVGLDGAIAYTTDGWVNWDRPADGNMPDDWECGGGNFDMYAVHFFDDNDAWDIGIIASEYGYCLVTTDGGVHWSTIDQLGETACPSDEVVGGKLEFWGMAFDDPLDSEERWWIAGGRGFAAGYIFYSDDQGDTWTQALDFNVLEPEADPFPLATIYDIDRVHSSTPWFLTAGYAENVLRYTASAHVNYDACEGEIDPPAGQSNVWVQKEAEAESIPSGSNEPPLFGLGRISDSSACLTGHFGRILLYENDTFDDVATKYHNRLADGAFVNDSEDDTGVVVGQGRTIWRTTNSGTDWTLESTWSFNSTDWATGVDLSSHTNPGEYGVVIGTGNFIAWSDDYGDTWSQRTYAQGQIPQSFPELNAVAFVPNSAIVYAVGNYGIVLKSEDYGETWDDVATLAVNLHGVSFVSDDVGFVCGDDGKVYRTLNGETFSEYPVTGTPDIEFFDIAAWSPSGGGLAAIVVGEDGAVYSKSTSDSTFNSTSHSTSPEITETLIDVEVLNDGANVRIAGELGGLLFRDTGTWTAPKSLFNFPIRKLAFQSASHGYSVGSIFMIGRYE